MEKCIDGMRVYICSKDCLFSFTEKAMVGGGDRGGGRRTGKKGQASKSLVLGEETSILVAGMLAVERCLGLTIVMALGVSLGVPLGVVGLAVVSAVVGRLASRDDRVVGLTRRASASTRARRRNEQDSRRLCDHFRWGGPTFGW